MVDVRESVTHLFSLGRFEDVQVHAERADGGAWRCATTSIPIHPVAKIAFAGRLDAARHRRRTSCGARSSNDSARRRRLDAPTRSRA